ncbi:hypothetical protein VTH06DRAFT_8579 [Thermothelomyces fergusii]
MAPATRLCLLLPLRPAVAAAGAAVVRRSNHRRLAAAAAAAAARAIHTHPAQPAKVVPVYGTGPPPEPPQPSAEPEAEEQAERRERLARRKRQAELLRHATDGDGVGGGRTADGAKTRTLRRRFWKHVYVREVDGASSR